MKSLQPYVGLFVRAFGSRKTLPYWGAVVLLSLITLAAFNNASPTKDNSVEPAPPQEVTVKAEEIENALTEAQRQCLAANGWEDRVGEGLGVWVSIRDQRLRVIQRHAIVWETACSTAAKGPGFKVNSNQTPLGWHSVAEKIGDNAPWGQVFREKKPTKEIYNPGTITSEDLVLTRVLVLTGEEPGKNKGGDVDSYDRGIYIHATNDEANIGKPASHGCVRLTNDDVIRAYDLIPVGTPVLIAE